MARSIALLRAVNVGGTGKVGMADLRAMCEAIGLAGAKTLLQSGNLVVDGGKRSSSALESMLEKAAANELDLRTEFIVRSAPEWAEIIAENPFPEMAQRDPGHLLLLCRKTAPTKAQLATLKELHQGPEEFVARGRDLYATFPDGIGRSKFATLMMRDRVGSPGTGRNWNTVLKIAAMLSA